MTLGTFLNLSELQFPYLEKNGGNNDIPLTVLFVKN